MAAATFLQTYHHLIPAVDLVAHTRDKCSAAVFAKWAEDTASAVFYAGADCTDAPLGYAVLTTPDFPAGTGPADIELRRIYTLATTHGAGLGPALIAAALAEARKRGHARVLLGVQPDNARARRFYERNGFRVVGGRVFTVGTQRFTDPIYALDL